MTGSPRVIVRTLPTGDREVAKLVTFRHRIGRAEVRCLARLFLPATSNVSGRPTAVVSSLRGNPRRLGISISFPDIATAVVKDPDFVAVPGQDTDVDPTRIRWLEHHGPFSAYYDYDGSGESFSRVTLRWQDDHYDGDLDGHHLLPAGELPTELAGIELRPVLDVVEELDGSGPSSRPESQRLDGRTVAELKVVAKRDDGTLFVALAGSRHSLGVIQPGGSYRIGLRGSIIAHIGAYVEPAGDTPPPDDPELVEKLVEAEALYESGETPLWIEGYGRLRTNGSDDSADEPAGQTTAGDRCSTC